jgi:hypothetical protein
MMDLHVTPSLCSISAVSRDRRRREASEACHAVAIAGLTACTRVGKNSNFSANHWHPELPDKSAEHAPWNADRDGGDRSNVVWTGIIINGGAPMNVVLTLVSGHYKPATHMVMTISFHGFLQESFEFVRVKHTA